MPAVKTPKLPRQRVELEPRFNSLDECDAALLRVAQIDRETAANDAEYNAAIEPFRKECEEKNKPLVAEKLDLETQLNLFNEANRDTIYKADSKTVKLTFGELNFRVDPPSTSCPRNKEFPNDDARIAALKRRFKDARIELNDSAVEILDVIIRTKETINKDGVLEVARNLDQTRLARFEDKLKLCGIVIVRGNETFGYNLYEEAIAAKLEKRGGKVLDMNEAAARK